jgi:hypothetical protein
MRDLQDCSFRTEKLSEKEKLVFLTVQISDQEYKGVGITARLALEDLMQKVLEVEE